jgi:Mn2+/Fe2+ NRAMP family transporter
VILVVMLFLINDKRIMGRFTNGRVFNVLSWVTTVILIVLALFLVFTTFFPGVFGSS